MKKMENTEEVLQILETYTRTKPKEIPEELENYLRFVASTGDTVFKWPQIQHLLREKLINVITEFHDTTPSIQDLPHYPNVDPFNFEAMKKMLIERMDSFRSAPFTVQRICELLTEPRKQYSRIDKFMRAVEKTILVVSCVEPKRKRNESENGESLDSTLSNGEMASSDVEVENDHAAANGNKENQEPPVKAADVDIEDVPIEKLEPEVSVLTEDNIIPEKTDKPMDTDLAEPVVVTEPETVASEKVEEPKPEEVTTGTEAALEPIQETDVREPSPSKRPIEDEADGEVEENVPKKAKINNEEPAVVEPETEPIKESEPAEAETTPVVEKISEEVVAPVVETEKKEEPKIETETVVPTEKPEEPAPEPEKIEATEPVTETPKETPIEIPTETIKEAPVETPAEAPAEIAVEAEQETKIPETTAETAVETPKETPVSEPEVPVEVAPVEPVVEEKPSEPPKAVEAPVPTETPAEVAVEPLVEATPSEPAAVVEEMAAEPVVEAAPMEDVKPIEDVPMKDDATPENKMQTDDDETAAAATAVTTAMDVDENSAGAELMDQ